jgi:hypothetical protein
MAGIEPSDSSDDRDSMNDDSTSDAESVVMVSNPVISKRKNSPPKKKSSRKKAKRIFKEEWTRKFAWLTKKNEAGVVQPYCPACKKVMGMNTTAIERHGKGNSHKNNQKVFDADSKSRTKVDDMWAGIGISHADTVATIEMKVAMFITEHNLPVSLSDKLIPFLKDLFPTKMADVKLGKQKCTNTVRQVLGYRFMKDNVDFLRCHKYSIFVDESTDRATISQCAIVAAAFDPDTFHMNIILLDMVELQNGEAVTIANETARVLEERRIEQNLIGFCGDTCNTMFGIHHSVSTILREKYPWIVIVKCTCHSLHLAASYASRQLPKFIEDVCRNVFDYFHTSPKRTKAFAEFQEFFETPEHKLLKYGKTRWLGIKQCVDRLLEQLEALERYFQLEMLENPSHTVERILENLRNKFTKLYLEFLSYNLGRFVSVNTLFQTEKPLLQDLGAEVETLINSFKMFIMSVADVRAGKAMDPIDRRQLLPVSKIYLGPAATDTLEAIVSELGESSPHVILFLEQCQNFIIEAINQMQKRFDGLDQFQFLSLLKPANASSLIPPSLAATFRKFPPLNDVAPRDVVDGEWRQHVNLDGLSGEMDIMEYWRLVFSAKLLNMQPKYPHLRKIVSALFSLPFANGPVERVFSQMKLIKSDVRNSLKEQTFVALMTAKIYIQNLEKKNPGQGQSCQTALYKPDREMFRLHKKMIASADDEEAKELRRSYIESM